MPATLWMEIPNSIHPRAPNLSSSRRGLKLGEVNPPIPRPKGKAGQEFSVTVIFLKENPLVPSHASQLCDL